MAWSRIIFAIWPRASGIYAFLLNPQGQFLAILCLQSRRVDRVDTDHSQVEKILATFDHYIIMDDVEVANLSEQMTALGIGGPEAREVLATRGFDVRRLHPLQIAVDARGKGMDCTLVRSDDRPGAAYEIWIAPEECASFGMR